MREIPAVPHWILGFEQWFATEQNFKAS